MRDNKYNLKNKAMLLLCIILCLPLCKKEEKKDDTAYMPLPAHGEEPRRPAIQEKEIPTEKPKTLNKKETAKSIPSEKVLVSITWNVAKDFCQLQQKRMPSKAEAFSLSKTGKYSSVIWTSTELEEEASQAWVVDLGSGKTNAISKEDRSSGWCMED